MNVPGVIGAGGAPVPLAAPYAASRPGSEWAARNMMAQSVPLNMVQFNPATQGGLSGPPGAMLPAAMAPGGGILMPPGLGLPPGMGAPPGMPGMPGMGMPGMNPIQPTGGVMPAGPIVPPGGIMQAGGAGAHMNAVRFNAQRTQVRFDRPAGMKVSWYTQGPDGQPAYSNVPIETPGRYNFAQGAIYRLKISNIEGRPGLEVYPTMEVVPANPKSEAFLAHAAVPVSFTNDDFKQIAEGSFLIKVIYLPDRQFQEAGGAAIDEISSTRLDPGVDPVEEAARRGCILLILRMGNVDQEAPNTPGLTAPAQQGPGHAPMMPMFPAPPHTQVPYHQNFGPHHTPGIAGPIGALPPGALPPGPLPPGIHPHAQSPVAAPSAHVPGIPTSRKGAASISDDGKSPVAPAPFVPPLPRTAPAPMPPAGATDLGLPPLPPVSALPNEPTPTVPDSTPVAPPTATNLPTPPAAPVTPAAMSSTPPALPDVRPDAPITAPASPIVPPAAPIVAPIALPPAPEATPIVTPPPLPPSASVPMPQSVVSPIASPIAPPMVTPPAAPPVVTPPAAPLSPAAAVPAPLPPSASVPMPQSVVSPIASPIAPPMVTPPAAPLSPAAAVPAPLPPSLVPPVTTQSAEPAPTKTHTVVPGGADAPMPEIVPASATMPSADAFGIRTIVPSTTPVVPAIAPMPPAGNAGVRTLTPDVPTQPVATTPVNPGMPTPPSNLPQLPTSPLR